MKYQNRQSGFTLIEILVSSFILILVVVAASQMYITASAAQRRAHGKQNALDSSRYALEYMARSIRQSRIPSDAFDVNNQVYMIHQDDEKCRIGGQNAPCRVYFRRTSAGRIQEAIVQEDNANPSGFQNITGFGASSGDTANVIVESLLFTGSGQDSGVHPKVTISMTVRPDLQRPTEETRVRIQTTISSRDPRWLSTQ